MKKTFLLLALAVLVLALSPGLAPRAEAASGIVEVSTLAELRAACKVDGSHILLKNDITGDGAALMLPIDGDRVILDLGGHILRSGRTDSSGSIEMIRVLASDVTITNGTLLGTNEHDHGIWVKSGSGDVTVTKILTSGTGCSVSSYAGENTVVRVRNCTFSSVPKASVGTIHSCRGSTVIVEDTNITFGGTEDLYNHTTYAAFQCSEGGKVLLSHVIAARRTEGNMIEFSCDFASDAPVCGDFMCPNTVMKVDDAEIPRTRELAATSSGSKYRFLTGKKMIVSTEPEPVYRIPLTIVSPAIGKAPSYDTVLPDTVYRDVISEGNLRRNLFWYDDTAGKQVDKNNGLFLAGHQYSLHVTLTLSPGFECGSTVSATVNGKAATAKIASSRTELEVTYSFPKLDAVPTISSQPKSISVVSGKTAAFSVTAAGGNLKYQWQYSTDGGKTWKNWSGKTSASVSVTATANNDGVYYRCKVTNAAGSVFSTGAKLTTVTKPEITSQPKSVSVASGKTATFKVTASGKNLSYQWQYSTDGGKTFKTWSGKTSASVSVTATANNDGVYYRCKVTNAAGSVTSSSAKITVK